MLGTLSTAMMTATRTDTLRREAARPAPRITRAAPALRRAGGPGVMRRLKAVLITARPR